MTKKIVFLFAVCLITFNSGFAQNTTSTTVQPDNQFLFIQCTDIDFNKYSELVGQVKLDGRFEIASACIPAHVLMIKIMQPALLIETEMSNFNRFASIANASNINSATLLQNYNEQQFIDQCRSVRTGN